MFHKVCLVDIKTVFDSYNKNMQETRKNVFVCEPGIERVRAPI